MKGKCENMNMRECEDGEIKIQAVGTNESKGIGLMISHITIQPYNLLYLNS